MSARCEDFPCCGHELGCCPPPGADYMICTCGARVPLTSRYSICEGCLNRPDPDEPSDGMTDVEADADTLASAGMGTDEDYGFFGDENE